MKMWEEAPKTEIFGAQVYSFGLYCAIGAVCAAAAVCILCRTGKTKKGTGLILSCLSILSGAFFSRLTFCLLGGIEAGMLPFSYWFNPTTGGWSLFGMIFGVFAGAWLCAKLTGESSGFLLDTVSCALPLFMAAERFSEKGFELFDVSRTLPEGGFPGNTFLAVRDPYYSEVSYLATYLAAAIASIVLFLILVFFLTRSRREKDLWILFLILCGAGGVILESLRYDHYLEYHFVRFQQVLAAVLLAWGVILAGKRNRGAHRGLMIAGIISVIAAVGSCIAIEFALDRTNLSHYLLYLLMATVLAAPVTIGILLLRKPEREKA